MKDKGRHDRDSARYVRPVPSGTKKPNRKRSTAVLPIFCLLVRRAPR